MRQDDVERESIPPEGEETEEVWPERAAGVEQVAEDPERLDIEAAEQGHPDIERIPEDPEDGGERE